MADLRDFTGKNRKFTGTIGEKISTGTTGERDTSFGGGTLRFNSSTNLMEYYSGTEWKSIDAPPSITTFSINGGSPVTSGSLIQSSSNATIAITGSLFDTLNATVLFVGNGGGDVSPLTTVRNSTSLITVTVNTALFTDANEPYDIKVTNGSGLSALLENCITSNAAPAFITASGTLGTVGNGARVNPTLSTAAATDPDGDTITYSISAGSLPPGLSLNASTAAITGTATAVVSNTTSTFTVTASTTGQSTSRQFSITINAPVITTYTSGTGNFSVPAGVTAVDVLVIAGGGGGGGRVGGGGGAGGYIEMPGFPVTPSGTVAYSVGTPGGPGPQSTNGGPGGNSTFGTLTAIGGGGGAGDNTPTAPSGGSGGGTQYDGPTAGTGQQPAQPGNSGTFGFGNPGGTSRGAPHHSSGGGGGAGGAGTAGTTSTRGPGGVGKSSSISGSSVTRAGGGGGGGHPDSSVQSSGGPGGGGAGGPPGTGNGTAGTDNLGAGGGGATGPGSAVGGRGGSGVIIVVS
jgi:hypothetical protein